MIEFPDLGGQGTGVLHRSTVPSSRNSEITFAFSPGLAPYTPPRPIAEIASDAWDRAQAGISGVQSWIKARKRARAKAHVDAQFARVATQLFEPAIVDPQFAQMATQPYPGVHRHIEAFTQAQDAHEQGTSHTTYTSSYRLHKTTSAGEAFRSSTATYTDAAKNPVAQVVTVDYPKEDLPNQAATPTLETRSWQLPMNLLLPDGSQTEILHFNQETGAFYDTHGNRLSHAQLMHHADRQEAYRTHTHPWDVRLAHEPTAKQPAQTQPSLRSWAKDTLRTASWRTRWNERQAKREAWHAQNRTSPPRKRRRDMTE